MIFYKESDYQGELKQKVDSLLGNQISLNSQWKNGFIGSSLFRLRETKLNNNLIDNTYLNLRCNFEKRPNGLILRINQNQKLFNLAIDFDSIKKVTLINKESITPWFLSSMRILLKIGLHVRYARYFQNRWSDYSVEPLNLIIQTSKGPLRLDSNGYNYYNTLDYFNNTKLVNRIEIIE